MGGDYYIYHTKTDFYEYVSLSRRWSIDHLFSQSIFICKNQRLKYNVLTARKIICPIGNYNTIYDVPCKNPYIWFYCGETVRPSSPLSFHLIINQLDSCTDSGWWLPFKTTWKPWPIGWYATQFIGHVVKKAFAWVSWAKFGRGMDSFFNPAVSNDHSHGLAVLHSWCCSCCSCCCWLPSFALPKSQVRCVGRPQAGFKARRAPSESVLCHQKKNLET